MFQPWQLKYYFALKRTIKTTLNNILIDADFFKKIVKKYFKGTQAKTINYIVNKRVDIPI